VSGCPIWPNDVDGIISNKNHNLFINYILNVHKNFLLYTEIRSTTSLAIESFSSPSSGFSVYMSLVFFIKYH